MPRIRSTFRRWDTWIDLMQRLDSLIAADARIEVLCGGFEWAEGPVWVPEAANKFGGYVLFSDIPHNAVMKWQEGTGVSVFMKPAGYTGICGLRQRTGQQWPGSGWQRAIGFL